MFILVYISRFSDIRTYIQSIPKQFNGQLIKHGIVGKTQKNNVDTGLLIPPIWVSKSLKSLKQSKSDHCLPNEEFIAAQ